MAEELQFTASELALFYRVARTLLSERDYGELLAGLLDAAIEGLGADRGFVVVREGTGFRAAVARNFRSEALTAAEQEVSGSISSAVMEQGRTVLLNDALDSERFRDNPSVQRLGLRSVLCAPLVASSEAFALIYLENRDITSDFPIVIARSWMRSARWLRRGCGPQSRSSTPAGGPANSTRTWARRMESSPPMRAWPRYSKPSARWPPPTCRC